MADKLSVLNRNSELDMLADDDPLAELARIAGIERPAIALPSRQTQRSEPEFDLEDELLAEFERYDSPRLDASEIRPVTSRAVEPQPQRVEPVFEQAPVVSADPVAVEPVDPIAKFVAVPAELPDETPAEAVAAQTAIDLEDELLRALDPFISYPEPAVEVAPALVAEPAPVVVEPVTVQAFAASEPETVFAPVIDVQSQMSADAGDARVEPSAEDEDWLASLTDLPGMHEDHAEQADIAADKVPEARFARFETNEDADPEPEMTFEPVPAELTANEYGADEAWSEPVPADQTIVDESWDVESAFAATVAGMDRPAFETVDPDAGLDAFLSGGEATATDPEPVDAVVSSVVSADVIVDEPAATAEEPFDIEREFARTVATMRSDADDAEPVEADAGMWRDLIAATSDTETTPVLAEAETQSVLVVEPQPQAAEWLPESEPAIEEPVAPQQSDDWLVEDQQLKAEANAWLDEVEAEANRPTMVAAPVVAPAVAQPVSPDYSVDDLLADVERFPIPATQPDWMRPEQSRSAEKMPQMDAIPTAARTSPAGAPEDVLADFAMRPAEDASRPYRSLATPTAAPVQSAPVIAPVVAVAEAPAAAEVAPDPYGLDSDLDPFEDSDFEIDLGAIEIDLQDLEEIDEKPLKAPSAEVIPLVAASAPVLRSMADLDVAPAAREPVRIPPVAVAPAPVAGLPFDHTQIAETEDVIEQVMDFDVPDLPVDTERQPTPHADFDIDIDTEMGKLFAVPTPPVRPAAVRQPEAGAPVQPVTKEQASTDAIDAFERALEEDFRRSMAPEIAGRGEPERRTLTPGLDQLVRDEERPSRRPLLIAASVLALLAAGAAGGYAWYSGKTPLVASSSEPRIILADKSPVKVQPVDKGGQTVPNQDKAVYDKVAGAATETPKQEQLVSATEEPVDVVQKTLVPDTLPLDEDPAVTSTEDTSDPRLLPDTSTQPSNVVPVEKVATAVDNTNPAVQPRKVRTMVVKPDGTLVAREDTAPADAAAAAAADDALKAAQAGQPVPERLGTDVAAPGDVASTDAKPAVTENVADQPVEKPATAQVEAAPATATETETPVAETRNVEIDDPAADKPADTEVAALDAAANADVAVEQPAAATTRTEGELPVRVVKTTKVSVNAPIPEGRPVDQPVNVVSTVTDQGNVKQADDAQATQEVAKVEQPAAETQQAALPEGTYVIQIASLPSEADANASYSKLSTKFANVIGGKGVDIRKAQISGKGTFYRVRIPAGSKADAVALCERYRSAGGSCLVSK